jgi:hypothetical protein
MLGAVLALAAPSLAVADPPTSSTLETVDTALCSFPLDVQMSQAHTMHTLGSLSFFTGQGKLLLTNENTGQTAKLTVSGPFGYNYATNTSTFAGHQVWSGGWTPPGIPFESTDGAGSLTNFVLSPPANSGVVDPCALVGPTPNLTPAATPAPWNLPADALGQMAYAGLLPTIGAFTRQDNDHLDLLVNGQAVTVPAGVGLAEPVDNGSGFCFVPADGDCHSGDNYYPAVAQSPLSTISTSGIIHVQADRPGVYTLGQLFDEWGVRLNQSCVGSYCTGAGNQLAVYVNGTQATGDPRAVVLGEHQEIAVVYGGAGAFNSVPSTYTAWPDPSGGCGGSGEPSCV